MEVPVQSDSQRDRRLRGQGNAEQAVDFLEIVELFARHATASPLRHRSMPQVGG